jgi:hypothetical protein
MAKIVHCNMNFIPQCEKKKKSREKSCICFPSYFMRETGEFCISGAIMPIVKFELCEKVK